MLVRLFCGSCARETPGAAPAAAPSERVARGDCGYLQTDLTLSHVLSREGAHACDYVLVTNGDNLYARSLFSHACPHLKASVGMLGYYFASHYPYSSVYVAQGRVERKGPDVLFKTRLTKGWVDLGAVLIRADLLRSASSHGAAAASRETGEVHGQSPRSTYHFVDCGPWREADGRLVGRLARTNATRFVLDRILYLHQ